jgi:hypothetical protein
MPITIAPALAKSSVASAKAWASSAAFGKSLGIEIDDHRALFQRLFKVKVKGFPAFPA